MKEASFETKELRESIKWDQPISWLTMRLFATGIICGLIIALSFFFRDVSFSTIKIVINGTEAEMERYIRKLEIYVDLINLFQSLALVSVALNCINIFSKIYRTYEFPLKYFLKNGLMAIAMYVLVVFLMRYVIVESVYYSLEYLFKDSGETGPKVARFVATYIALFANKGLSIYNIFFDYVILGYFFVSLFYNPKHKVNKNILRCTSIVPVLYVSGCFIINVLVIMGVGNISINYYVQPLIVGKKILIYIFFFSLVTIMKIYSVKHDGEMPSPHWVSSVIVLLFLILTTIEGAFYIMNELGINNKFNKMGLGSNVFMFIGIPFAFYYDYTKHKDSKKLNMIAPSFWVIACGIAIPIVIVTYIEQLDSLRPYANKFLELLEQIIGGQ